MSDQALDVFLERLATLHPVTLHEVETFWVIAGRRDATQAACEAAADGYRHHDLCDALRHGEANTAEGIAHWLRVHRGIIGPR